MTSDPDQSTANFIAAFQAVLLRNLPLIGATLVLTLLYFALGPRGGLTWAVPVLLFAGLWLVLFGLADRADHKAIANRDAPEDGAWCAISGKATALQDAPGDILACRFQILDEEQRISASGEIEREKKLTCRYDGFYLVPTGIETATGTVPLMGFPDLVHMEKTSPDNHLLIRAKSAARTWPDWMPQSVVRQYVLSSLTDRTETAIRYGDKELSSEGQTKCWLLRPGDEVCVFGRWKDNALHPDPRRPRGLPVYAGTAEAVRDRLQEDSGAFLILGAIVLVLAAGIAAWSLIS